MRPATVPGVGIAALAFAALSGSPALANLPYAEALVARARTEDVASDDGWRALGHYVRDPLGSGVTSLVDNPSFFMASDGQTNPSAELDATIRAFFQPVTKDGVDAHPQCRKIARYRWLKSRLDFDPARLPEHRCGRYEEWIAEINPASLTLIFPAAYLNNPSSSFGHTLIRIDPPRQRPDTRLNAYTIHFAAEHYGQQGLPFVIKGLSGGYQGFFSLLRYYEKVAQYSDIENRDIWEYTSNFNPVEIERMLQSLWELDEQSIDYYFFTTNCSFVLLSLLNTGRPEMRLNEAFPLYAVPVDTVRAVIDKRAIGPDAVFRPSARTRIRDLQATMAPALQVLALRLAAGEETADGPVVRSLDPRDQAIVLEVAQRYLQYRLDIGKIGRDEMAPRSLALLHARARLEAGGAEPAPPAAPRRDEAPAPLARPDMGHGTARVGAAIGMTGERFFTEVRARPVYHDLLDPATGHVPGAAIELADLRVRHYLGEVPTVEQFTLVGIESFSPRDEIFRPISWAFRTGFDRWREDGDDLGDPVGSVGGSAGLSWSPGRGSLVSVLATAALLADDSWPEERIFAGGPSVAIVLPATEWWTLRLDGRWQGVVGSEVAEDRFRVALGQGFGLGQNQSLRLEAALSNDGRETFGEWLAAFHWYF
jgi:hypothetical protein